MMLFPAEVVHKVHHLSREGISEISLFLDAIARCLRVIELAMTSIDLWRML